MKQTPSSREQGVLLEGPLSISDTLHGWMAPVLYRILDNSVHSKHLGDAQSVITCLKWAVRACDPKLVKTMLERGAPVHSEVINLSVLRSACLSTTCNMEIFNMLLDHADPARLHQLGKQGLAPVHLLLQREITNREPKLRALLERGTDPNLYSRSGAPLIVLFLLEGHLKCVDILLECGADLNTKQKDGRDVALTAVSCGNLEFLEMIIKHEKQVVNWTSTCFVKLTMRRLGRPPVTMEFVQVNALHLAALNGHEPVLDFYLTNGLVQDLETVSLQAGFRPLHFACLGGSSSCIRLLVGRGADIRSLANDGSSCLHIAVKTRHVGATVTLIELGLTRDSVDETGTSPLMYAIKQGSTEIVDILLNTTPSISEESRTTSMEALARRKVDYLSSALEAAIKRADIRLCRFLWTAVCSLSLPLPSCRGCTPLMLALGTGRTEIAKWILETANSETERCAIDGQCNKHHRFGTTSLHIACGLRNRSGILNRLLDVYLKAGSNRLQWPLGVLHVCAANNNIKSLKIILDYVQTNQDLLRATFPGLPRNLPSLLLHQRISAVGLDYPYLEGLTPLHVAIWEESLDASKLLIESGADINQADLSHTSPLHLAVIEQHEIARELIRNGCLLDCQDEFGYTPLMRAVEDGSIDMVKLLVENCADITARDANRKSLLNIAGDSSKTPSIFQYLLGKGLDAYQADNFGYYALHDAILDANFTAYILNSGLDFYRACSYDLCKGMIAVALENQGILPRFLRRVPEEYLSPLINVYPPNYVSPLCNAARRDNVAALKLLLRYGAQIEFEGCDDGTALMAACRAGHLDAVAYLVRAG
ncbi:ankyrin repeat-containing domain protein [Xylariales sp. AK1849]|nr:ankyrin repeat-containing domain protein [Xylariales sp. AK1849]